MGFNALFRPLLSNEPDRIAMFLGKILSLAVLGLLIFAVGAQAQDVALGNPYEVTGVAVDAEAENPVSAKQNGLTEGRRLALRRILMRFVPEIHHAALPRLGDDEIDAMVEEFAVVREKSSTTRYLASLDFRFNTQDVRRVLKASSLPYSESRAKAILVLPLLAGAAEPVLFEGNNGWLSAWQGRANDSHELVPFVLPLGDLVDLSTMPATAAQNGSGDAVAAMAKRYGGTRVMVATAFRPAGASDDRLRLSATLYHDGGQTQYEANIRATGQTDLAGLFDQGAAVLVAKINEDWKTRTARSFAGGDVIRVVVDVADPGDWARMRRQLGSESAISKMKVIKLARSGGELELEFSGGIESLKLALRQRDLILREDEAGAYRLSPVE